ncbi:MAG TPA: alkaline phosphatase [Clostridiales bacterium]|nr:alkaline phosphatase [Clostridiales bacterium]
MKGKSKRILSALLMVLLIAATIIIPNYNNNVNASASKTSISKVIKETGATVPKYIFLFIGDGMSYPQIQATSYYLGTTASKGGVKTQALSFMNFPVAGSAQTFDSTSFCPDSASTATSISTGHKTYSGTINMDTSFKVSYETIAEKLKKQMDYKIGIISSVNLNHATPAAFYAHQASRNNYYEIGQEMIASGFDYFAGGELLKPAGSDNSKESIYDLAKKAGYRVVRTKAAAEGLRKGYGKSIIISEKIADGGAMPYELDATSNEWHLADYVEKGIEMLDNEKGFFMMVEGGKIDWACHANDATSTIHDTVALGNAVDVAIDFYNKHPEDTLILVTGDHETGGLTIGFAGTDYDTYLTNLENQKISYAKYDSDFVAGYKKNNTKFTAVLEDIQKYFGLVPKSKATAAANAKLILTDYEYNRLSEAYDMTMNKPEKLDQEEYVLYGTYEPLTVTITHILNNKSGIDFTSYSHTGLPVPVFAIGNGAELFEGYYDNTDIYDSVAKLTKVK